MAALKNRTGTAAERPTGIAYSVLAAASAAALLFLPLLVLGYSFYVVGALIQGEALAWQSTVAMTYTFLGIPALVALILLVIPYRLFRAAERRLGARPALRLTGGILSLWHVAVAAAWAWNSTSGFSRAVVNDTIWYPIVFGVAAVAATLIAERRVARSTLATAALVGVLALFLSGTVRGHAPVPAGAQVVHVAVAATARLNPATVNAGDIYVVLDTPRSSVAFTQDELTGTQIPLSGSFSLAGCTDAQRAADRGQLGYCGNVFRVTLPAGKYVFIGPSEAGPPSPGSRLEVVP